jgi:hypothetical protein
MDDYQMRKDSILSNLYNLGRPTLYNHNVNVSYTLPINRIKLLNFLSATARYQGTFNWQAGPLTADTIQTGQQGAKLQEHSAHRKCQSAKPLQQGSLFSADKPKVPPDRWQPIQPEPAIGWYTGTATGRTAAPAKNRANPQKQL